MLSVIIPAYNEAKTIRQVVEQVQDVPIHKELIIVNDGSTDGTFEILEAMRQMPGVKVIQCQNNRGKGHAIRLGLAQVDGDFVVIQDADLEVQPCDLLPVIEPLRKGVAQVVYGSRFAQGRNHASLRNYVANRLLAGFVNLIYGSRITDESTCYKAFDARVISGLNLTCEGFEFCPEVTAKVLRAGYRIHEVPISYFPRTKKQGKKLRFFRDGLIAVWTLFKYRFVPRWSVYKSSENAVKSALLGASAPKKH